MVEEIRDEREIKREQEQEAISNALLIEQKNWSDVLSTQSGRAFFVDILGFLGFGQPAFDLDEKKLVATTALKDAADALFARAMSHDKGDVLTMLEEHF